MAHVVASGGSGYFLDFDCALLQLAVNNMKAANNTN